MKRAEKQAEKGIQNCKFLEGDVKDNRKRIEGIDAKLPRFAERRDLLQIKNDLKNFCEYKDLKELYSKVMPPLQQMGEDLATLETNMNHNREIIRRFDEVLLDKASKVAVQEVYEYVARFLEKTPFEEHLEENRARHG